MNTETPELEAPEEGGGAAKDEELPPRWSTPRFWVWATERSLSMRRRRRWWDAATTLVFVFYGTAIAASTLAFVDPVLPLVGILLSSMGFMLAGFVRAERRASAPFARFVRRELEAGTVSREAAYRGTRSTAHVLLVDGRSLDDRAVRKIVLAHRSLPQRYGPSRDVHTVCAVLDGLVLRVEHFENDEASARRLGRALARALRYEGAIETLDESYAGGAGSIASLVLLMIFEIVIAIVVPMAFVFPLEKDPTLARSATVGISAALAVIACDVAVQLAFARAMRAGIRRHLARVFGVEV